MKHFKSIALFLILLAILTGFWAMVREMKNNAVVPPPVQATPEAAPSSSPQSALPLTPSPQRSLSSVKSAPVAISVEEKAQQLITARKQTLAAKFDLKFQKKNETPGSIQLSYEQKYKDISLYPRRGLTLTFNRQREFIHSDEWIQSELTIVNSRTLASDQARVYAFQALPESQSKLLISAPMEGGTAVVWASPTAVGRHAYVFNSRGIEIVVDAQSGAILAKKNRRME